MKYRLIQVQANHPFRVQQKMWPCGWKTVEKFWKEEDARNFAVAAVRGNGTTHCEVSKPKAIVLEYFRG